MSDNMKQHNFRQTEARTSNMVFGVIGDGLLATRL